MKNENENKKASKKDNKIYIISSITIVTAVLLIALLMLNNKELIKKISKETGDNIRFSQEYKGVPKDNVYVYRTAEQIIKILENGTGVVYLGFDECPACQEYTKYLNEVAKENGIEKIYYLDILKDRKENTKEYQKIVELLKDVLDHDEEGNHRVFVPDVTFVFQGKILSHNNETSVLEKGVTAKDYWTNENIEKFKKLMTSYMDDLQALVNSCTTGCED